MSPNPQLGRFCYAFVTTTGAITNISLEYSTHHNIIYLSALDSNLSFYNHTADLHSLLPQLCLYQHTGLVIHQVSACAYSFQLGSLMCSHSLMSLNVLLPTKPHMESELDLLLKPEGMCHSGHIDLICTLEDAFIDLNFL